MAKRESEMIMAISAGQTYRIAARFDKSLKLLRSAMAGMDLDVLCEMDVTHDFNGKLRKAIPKRILLIDCPLLAFEAVALDRAAAVFFPMHVLVSADGEGTQVQLVNMAELFDVRLPVGAAAPIERMHSRVAMGVESLVQIGKQCIQEVKYEK